MSEEQEVLEHWKEKAGTRPRSQAVMDAYLKRIRARLKDGYSVEELKRAVEVACWLPFYQEHGFDKQPAVIFRNAERIDTLLLKWERERERPIPL